MSLGTIFTAATAIAIISFLYISMGYGMSLLYEKNNEMIADGQYYSQARKDAVGTYFHEWYVFPAVFVVLIFVAAILVAVRDKESTI